MNVLGFSCHYHDAAACLVRDGRIVVAAEEERFFSYRRATLRGEPVYGRGLSVIVLSA